MNQKQITFLTDLLAYKEVRIGSTVYKLVDQRETIFSGDQGDYKGDRIVEEWHDPTPNSPDGSVSFTATLCDLIDLLDHVGKA